MNQNAITGKTIVLIMALLCAALGVMPHLFIAFQLTPGTIYQGAWDEMFYLMAIYGEIPSWNNYPIKQGLDLIIDALGFRKSITTISLDALLPFLIVISAGVLARIVVKSPIAVVLVTFLLVFGSDILSFNSTVAFLPDVYLSQWISEGTLYQRQFLVDSLATYLKIYRTPEPQLSISFFLLHLAGLVSFIMRPYRLFHTALPLLITSLFCVTIYSFLSLASLSFTAAAFIAILIGGDRKKLLQLGFILLISLVGTGFILITYYSNEASASVFASRLPAISPSFIYGMIGIAAIFLRYRSNALKDSALLFSLALLLFPLFVLNQQVLTGFMVQTLNWERYVTIPAIITATAIAFFAHPSAKELDSKIPHLFANVVPSFIWTGLATAMIAIYIFQAQLRTYQQWLSFNVITQAYATAIDTETELKADKFDFIVLDKMHMDAAIRARSKSKATSNIYGYSWIVTTAFGAIETEDINTTKQYRGFQVAAKLGLDVPAYRIELEKELKGNYCWPHLMYLADFLECAPYVSDFRKYNEASLQNIVDRGVNSYEKFLVSEASSENSVTLLLTTTQLEENQFKGFWANELLSETEITANANWLLPTASAKVYAYRQTRK